MPNEEASREVCNTGLVWGQVAAVCPFDTLDGNPAKVLMEI